MTRARSAPRRAPRPETPPATAPAPHTLRTAWLLALMCFGVYLTNLRPMGAWDSIPARVLPFSILHEGNLNLDEFAWLRERNPEPYFLRQGRDGHWLSRYPIALPVLATPVFAPAAWWLTAHHIGHDDVRFRLASVVMERVAAALVVAISVALMYLALCAFTSAGTAAALTLVYALGTSTWSIGSQAMWQHGLSEVGLAGVSLYLLRPDTRRHAIAAGGFAALGVLARPTMAVFALAALVYVWRERRRHLGAFVSLPIIGMLALFAYNRNLGSIVRGGYGNARFVRPRLARLVGLLFSPSRGLLVYTPFAALALPTLLPGVPRRSSWLMYLGGGIGGYLLLYSAWVGWWGGQTFGPRFFTDALPAIVLCAAPTVERLWRVSLGRVLVAFLVAWSVAVQVIGVYYDDRSWNQEQAVPWRVWALTDMQIVHAAGAGWHGTDLAPLLWQALTDPRPVLLQQLAPSELAGDIAAAEPTPLRLHRGTPATVRLHVTNKSHTAWPAFSDYGYLECKLVYRWWAGETLAKESAGIALPRNLGPGESTPVNARVQVPAHPGTYELELLLVQVLDLDKGTSGGTALRVPVQVE